MLLAYFFHHGSNKTYLLYSSLSVTKVHLYKLSLFIWTFILSHSAGGNAKLRYQITSGNMGGVFDVEPEVGTIFIAQPLDYEQNKR